MKILMLISELDLGGAETHVESLCRALGRLGHETAVLSRGGVISERMRVRGIRQILIKNKQGLIPSTVELWDSICRAVREESPDIVHAHSRREAAVASPICASLGIPLVVTAHAMFSMTPLKSRLSRWGDRTVAVSEDIKAHLIKQGGVESDAITVIENGVEIPERRSRKGASGHHILFLSRMDADCSLGAFLLCEIAPSLSRVFPDLRITLAGGGDRLLSLIKRAEEVNARVGRRVIFTVGRVEDPTSLYPEADLFVGVSRAALEAMAAGVPAILLGNEGFSGLIREESFHAARSTNFCARGCRHATAELLRAEIFRFFALGVRERSQISDFCADAVSRCFSADEMARKTAELYASLLRREDGGVRALLCGYSGFGNLGDDAIAESVVKNLAAEGGNLKLFVLGSKCGLTPCGARDSTHSRVGFSLALEAVREIGRADVFIFGGGSLLQNKSSDRSLAYYIFLIFWARLHCKKLIMLANGIGPIDHALWQRAALWAVSLFDVITARDARSLGLLRRALPKRSAFLFPDPAILHEQTLASEGGQDGSRLFAVCLCADELKRSGISAKSVAEALLHLSRVYFLTPFFTVMDPRADLELTRQVCRLFSAKRPDLPPLTVFCPKSVPSALRELSQARFLISMRYHASLFSALSDVPPLSVSSDPKLSSLSDELSLFRSIPPAVWLSGDSLSAYVDGMLKNYQAERANIQKNLAKMRRICLKRFSWLKKYLNTLDFEG